ncbi:hypothetical protein [Microbacterium sp.]|uniref:hypothetical protein n=1 Tax=Microbacterium sp. TaxID=51671 RepID=UPI00333EF678
MTDTPAPPPGDESPADAQVVPPPPPEAFAGAPLNEHVLAPRSGPAAPPPPGPQTPPPPPGPQTPPPVASTAPGAVPPAPGSAAPGPATPGIVPVMPLQTGASSPPPNGAGPASDLPPYARFEPAQTLPGGYPVSAYSTAAPPAPRSSANAVRGCAIIIAVFVVIVAIVIGIFALVIPRALSAADRPAPVTTSGPDAGTWPGTGGEASPAFLDDIRAKIDEYKQGRRDGTLWERLPNTEFNQTAVTAFLYFLTDMKLAVSFGVDDAKIEEYTSEMADLERKLLAQEPLSSDIDITFSDTRSFHYDGATGEGGYTDG